MQWQTTSTDPLRQALEVRKVSIIPSVEEESQEGLPILNHDFPFELLQGESLHGSLESVYLTNYRLYISTCSSDIPISVVRFVKLEKTSLLISTTECRTVVAQFHAADGQTISKFVDLINMLVFSTRDIPFALVHKGKIGNLFSVQTVFSRVNFANCRVSEVNLKFAVCPTYPERLIVPASVTDEMIRTGSEFRDKQRFPICSYPGLWRSAQPKTGGLGNRSEADELMLREIGNKLLILDLRPMINALANQLIQGSGSENLANYPNVTELVFCDIPNIHVVRDAFDQIFQEIANINWTDRQYGWWPIFEKSGWYTIVGKIIKAASLAQTSLAKGQQVLVHCSDGWDRTPQVTSLVMLMEDSYYRTFEGFAELVEQEWLAYGHKLHDRLCMGTTDSREFSPVLMQWLDCVHQAVVQHPNAFEFDQQFLVQFYNMAISAKYGNFIFNSAKERCDRNVYDKCTSLWPALFRLYSRRTQSNKTSIRVDDRAFAMKIWNSFWLSYT